ncbi:hypothetical protein LUW76_14575 [Actinomadura madurae]|uniref:DUF6879 family protein n=1 Tax=Actinomadura madurae TaxID=1993 RepID=UPI0020275C6C|nr:DUF6879 family protein [Actinomadura madurae]URM95448.1 hypothetical protein LUW76_14575 [Actinomadura madurae]URN06143.1 hypothetical protein LUW74_24385 [Actinomadura madurae]
MGRVFHSLADKEFNSLFSDFEYTAYRLESLQSYDVSYEKEEFGLFLAGQERGEFPGIADWIEGSVRPADKAGKRMHRVHVVEEPLSDYVRFECAWSYEHTVPAGEDVRIIPVRQGEWPEGLPHYDYWLFDSCRLVTMHYEEDGAFAAAEIVDDPAKIVQANYWRDLAVSRAVPYQEFAARYDGRFLPLSG